MHWLTSDNFLYHCAYLYRHLYLYNSNYLLLYSFLASRCAVSLRSTIVFPMAKTVRERWAMRPGYSTHFSISLLNRRYDVLREST